MSELLLQIVGIVVGGGVVFAWPEIVKRMKSESPHHRLVRDAFKAYRDKYEGELTQPKPGCVQLTTHIDDVLMSIMFDLSGTSRYGRTVITAFPRAGALPSYEVINHARWGKERAPEVHIGDGRFDARFDVRSHDAAGACAGLVGRARRLMLAMENPPSVFSDGDCVRVWWSDKDAPFEQVEPGLKIAALLATVCAEALSTLRADADGRVRIGDVGARATFEERDGHFGLFVECEPRRIEKIGDYDLTKGEGPISPSSLRAIGATGAHTLNVRADLWTLSWPGIPAARGLGAAVAAFVTEVRGVSSSYR